MTQIPETQIQTVQVNEMVIPIFDLALAIDEWRRQGPSYVDDQRVEVVAARGGYAVATFDEYDAGYPYRRGHRKAIVPLAGTECIIVKVTRRDDTIDPPIHEVRYYAYIKGFGWYEFTKNDAIKINATGVPKEKLPEVVENLTIYE